MDRLSTNSTDPVIQELLKELNNVDDPRLKGAHAALERTHANQLEVDQDYWPEEAEKVYEEIEKDSNSSEEKVLKLNDYLDYTAQP